MTIRMKKLCARAVGKWGSDRQILKAVEKFAELIDAIMQYRKGSSVEWDVTDQYRRLGNLIGEIADAEIMLSQLRGMFNAGGQIDQVVQSKLDRLEKLLDKPDYANEAAEA